MRVEYPTPCFILEREKLQANLAILAELEVRTGVRILHTLKSFDRRPGLEMIAQSLSGFSLGNRNECATIQGLPAGHRHTYAPAFMPGDVAALARCSDTMSFNSLTQWDAYGESVASHTSPGLRINLGLTLEQPPHCDPNRTERLGVPVAAFIQALQRDPGRFRSLEGLHIHGLCGQDTRALRHLLGELERRLAPVLSRIQWLNLGGGHRFTDPDYDREVFITLMTTFRDTFPHLTILFEPGESLLKGTGYLLSTVCDILPDAAPPTVILDTSTEVHMLDVAITGVAPRLHGALAEGREGYPYRLTGASCIAGDVIGTYTLPEPLQIGDRIRFDDMIAYTLVKQTRFNGIEPATCWMVQGGGGEIPTA